MFLFQKAPLMPAAASSGTLYHTFQRISASRQEHPLLGKAKERTVACMGVHCKSSAYYKNGKKGDINKKIRRRQPADSVI